MFSPGPYIGPTVTWVLPAGTLNAGHFIHVNSQGKASSEWNVTMADECHVSKLVTKFLHDTCRLPPWPSRNRLEAAMTCGKIATEYPPEALSKQSEYIPLITGSVAEFYIEPMLPLVGDIDVMYHSSTDLAIPREYPPPTRLPANEFHNDVQVFEITDDSEFPGYVYLSSRYLLTQSTDNGEYYCTDYDMVCIVNTPDDSKALYHGPAKFTDNSHTPLLSTDSVYCVRCLSWPPQAADWPTRHRNYGWPDSATLDRVVSNGCDLVPVAHRHTRQCKHRQHEWMGEFQHRLSFSRAEIVLINSWVPEQQIVYHMLRYFMKTERLTECADNFGAGTLSNYHIKTLMLWACELKPKSWWTENLNLVRVCAELLHTLSVWLTETRCKHYFINNCNLLDNSFNVGSVASKLIPVNEEYLSTWFVHNYIGQCAQLPDCPLHISRLGLYFNDFSDTTDITAILQMAASVIVRWRLHGSLTDFWTTIWTAQMFIPRHVSLHSLTVRSYVCWMNELTKIDKHLCVYFSAAALLHVARKISRNGFNQRWMDILKAILGPNFYQCCSVSYGRKIKVSTSGLGLVQLLQKSAGERLREHRQFEARNFGSVATIVTTDYEALYAYKRGDYQRCLQLSTQNVHALLCNGLHLAFVAAVRSLFSCWMTTLSHSEV